MSAFNAASIETDYAFIDKCPPHVLADIVTFPHGSLTERVTGIQAWHEALLQGTLPSIDTWPPPHIAAPARQALTQLDLPRFCRGQEDLTADVLADVVKAFRTSLAEFERQLHDRLAELEELERQRMDKEAAESVPRRESTGPGGAQQGRDRSAQGSEGEQGGAPGNVSPSSQAIDEQTAAKLQHQADEEVRALQPLASAALLQTWEEQTRLWTSIEEVFGDLGYMLGRGFDLSQGVLQHTGWKDLVRLHALVEKLPQLKEIVRSLGRLHDSETGESVIDSILEPVIRLEEEIQEVPTPLVPAETRGIERSGNIARMLPVEAMNLGHPKLRMLWHARRAERALLTYRVSGVEIERVLVEREAMESGERKSPRPERGPIVAVLDTSGSMHGPPELVAKALVLEMMRTAHQEKRRCLLYAYSGPSQVLEHELDLSSDGIGRLLAFLGFSFGGGTDIGALRRVVARLKDDAWKKADVIIATDGEWRAQPEIVAAVASAREEMGTRFHGVQIGNRGRSGLHQLCDPVHNFQDWAGLEGHRRH